MAKTRTAVVIRVRVWVKTICIIPSGAGLVWNRCYLKVLEYSKTAARLSDSDEMWSQWRRKHARRGVRTNMWRLEES